MSSAAAMPLKDLLLTASEQAVPITCLSPEDVTSWAREEGGATAAWITTARFKGEAGRILLIPDAEGGLKKVLYGLGKVDGVGAPEDAHLLAGLSEGLPPGDYRFERLPGGISEAHAAADWLRGVYRYDRYKSRPVEAEEADAGPEDPADPRPIDEAPTMPRLVAAALGEAESSRIVQEAEGAALTRDLVNTPASDMGPEELEGAARELAERFDAHMSVTRGEDLLAQNFPMIHAVGRASDRRPRLIDMTWGDEDAPKLTLVGKGVCFDTGGLNLKPGSSMELMKKDMGGAAHVLGLAHMIMAAELNVRLRVLVPAVENSVSGNAFRPGDVLASRKGLSVEIGNTDAEGRLVLADALALGDEEEPDLMIDMATLTGAARVALGPELPPFYTDDDALADGLSGSALAMADPLWRMPLWRPYLAGLESKTADINHISPGGFAGSITAALFLSKFVERATAWAHFDIYAWRPKPAPGRALGGEAQGLIALMDMLRTRFG